LQGYQGNVTVEFVATATYHDFALALYPSVGQKPFSFFSHNTNVDQGWVALSYEQELRSESLGETGADPGQVLARQLYRPDNPLSRGLIYLWQPSRSFS